MKALSITEVVRRCGSLIGSRQIDATDREFLRAVLEQTGNGEQTVGLDETQLERLVEIYEGHFG